MTRIFAIIPVRNEAGRYLESVLDWHLNIFDGIAVYDDQSDDNTIEIVKEFNIPTMVRPDNIPSFLDHEGFFRQASWRYLIDTYNPGPYDWIFALDADEFLVSDQSEKGDFYCIERTLKRHAERAVKTDYNALSFAIPEVWELNKHGRPQTRQDGSWGSMWSSRAARYQIDTFFPDKAMGSRNLPAYAAHAFPIPDLQILHYGYLRPEDRDVKYERYKTHGGHNPPHVESILSKDPLTKSWTGMVPEVW